jgi:hypothetical protein
MFGALVGGGGGFSSCRTVELKGRKVIIFNKIDFLSSIRFLVTETRVNSK